MLEGRDRWEPEVDGLDPDEWSWAEGVDYLAGWRDAQEVAREVNAAMDSAGLLGEVRAAALTDADGRGRVKVRCSLEGARKLSALVLARTGRAPDSGAEGSR
ncbi:hypothetical protein GCM10027168_35630 [Streptomyces capparidis]